MNHRFTTIHTPDVLGLAMDDGQGGLTFRPHSFLEAARLGVPADWPERRIRREARRDLRLSTKPHRGDRFLYRLGWAFHIYLADPLSKKQRAKIEADERLRERIQAVKDRVSGADGYWKKRPDNGVRAKGKVAS